MDKPQTFTKYEANVLTPKGFAAYFAGLCQNTTQVQAYELTEAKHMEVDMDGARKYGDLSSFLRLWYKMKAERQ